MIVLEKLESYPFLETILTQFSISQMVFPLSKIERFQ